LGNKLRPCNFLCQPLRQRRFACRQAIQFGTDISHAARNDHAPDLGRRLAGFHNAHHAQRSLSWGMRWQWPLLRRAMTRRSPGTPNQLPVTQGLARWCAASTQGVGALG